jgi:serine O-acetyltransferase
MRVRFLRTIREDLDAVLERDPAARNRLEVALLYPGVHAVWTHRVSNRLWRMGAKLPARALSQASRFATMIEIHPGATIGPRLFIDHGAGVVIGETATIGADVTLYHGATLGGTSLNHGKRHPTVGDRVMVGSGAKLLGPIEVGDDSRIGANAVLIKSVSDHSVVVGVPGQVVAPSATSPAFPIATSPVDDVQAEGAPRRSSTDQSDPDPLAFAVKSLLRRVEALEEAKSGEGVADRPLYRDDGVWETTDYAI